MEALANREKISFGAALRRAAEAPGISTRAANGIADFVALLDEARELSATAPPEEVLEAVLRRSGYLTELEDSLDPQDATRVENLQELVSVAREYSERMAALIAAAAEVGDEPPVASLAGFLEQVSLVADADEIPTDEAEVYVPDTWDTTSDTALRRSADKPHAAASPWSSPATWVSALYFVRSLMAVSAPLISSMKPVIASTALACSGSATA